MIPNNIFGPSTSGNLDGAYVISSFYCLGIAGRRSLYWMLLLAESAVKPNQQLHASYNTAEARTAQVVCRTAGPQRAEGLGLQDLRPGR